MVYDHQDDAQMVFEGCYQLVITTAFLVRLWNEIWNRNKVNISKQRDASLIFSQSLSLGEKVISLWYRHYCYEQFRCLYEAMNDHWNIFTNDLEVRILKNYSNISQKFTIFYSSEYILDYVNLFAEIITMVSRNHNFY